MNAPALIREASPIRDLAWWAAEAERRHTDWRSLFLTTARKLGLIPCPICGCVPCGTPSFCELAREADAKAAVSRSQRAITKPRPTPQATIEAIKQAVRGRGERALSEFSTLERLRGCDEAALTCLDAWLLKRGVSR